MGKGWFLVLAVIVVLAAVLYGSCLLLFRTGAEVKFRFGEPKKKGKPSDNPAVLAMGTLQAQGQDWMNRQPFQTVSIQSRDGLTLIGHWLPCPDAKRTVLLCHGWKGSWQENMVVFGPFLQAQQCNLLFMEQRGHGESEGKYLGFGVLERYDCLGWVRWMQEHTPSDLPIYLMGGSLGAATVLMTSGFDLPAQIHGIIADCGFVSPEEQIGQTLKAWWHLPRQPFLFIADRIARRKAGFSFWEYSTLKAMETNTKPILFIHGMEDRFVPTEGTLKNYNACRAEKELFLVEGARHMQSYLLATAEYQERLNRFFAQHDQEKEGAT